MLTAPPVAARESSHLYSRAIPVDNGVRMTPRFARLPLILGCLFLLTPVIPAQEAEPAWAILESGRRYFRDGRYGEALRRFRQVLDVQPENSEAAYSIGRIFEEHGDYREALRYYGRALEGTGFTVPEREARVRYRRAQIHETRGDFGRYEREMAALFELDDYYSSDETAPQRQNQLRLVRERSLSRALVLYRIEAGPFADPHTDYGAYLVHAGRFAEATPHLVRSVLESFSHAIERYRRIESRYTFETLGSFLNRIESVPGIVEFLAERRIWEGVYYLATSLYFDGYSTRGRELWHFLSGRSEAGEWADAANRQLSSPRPPTFPRRAP